MINSKFEIRNSKFGIQYFVFITFLMAGTLILPDLAHAQILPACTATGNCGICDFLDTFANIIRWLLGIVGGTALLLMIWHGFGWLTAAGNKERIDSARKGMLHTVIGIIIILGAWQVVNMVIVMLVTDPGQEPAKLFGNNQKIWYQYCSGTNICQGRGIGSPCGNGNFCYANKCQLVPVNIGGITYEDACDFWKKYDAAKMGGFNPYSEYGCRSINNCDPYENLGAAYCDKTGESCCKSKADNQ